MHQVLTQLMAAGLSWEAARAVPLEEVLCLLSHQTLSDSLAALDGEAARVASLPLADELDQHKQLAAIRMRARALTDRFYRPVRKE